MTLFCHITSQIKGEKHANLLSLKGGSGFPYLTFMDDEGNVLNKPRGRSVEAFQAGAKIAQHYLDLRNKQDRTAAEDLELLKLQLQYATTTVEAAKAATAKLELTDEQTAELSQLITALGAKEVDKRIMGVIQKAGINSREDFEAKKAEMGKEMYALHEEGLRPSGKEPTQMFWFLIFEHGVATKDVKAAEIGFAGFEKTLAGNPRAAQFLAQQRARLEAIKK